MGIRKIRGQTRGFLQMREFFLRLHLLIIQRRQSQADMIKKETGFIIAGSVWLVKGSREIGRGDGAETARQCGKMMG